MAGQPTQMQTMYLPNAEIKVVRDGKVYIIGNVRDIIKEFTDIYIAKQKKLEKKKKLRAESQLRYYKKNTETLKLKQREQYKIKQDKAEAAKMKILEEKIKKKLLLEMKGKKKKKKSKLILSKELV
jgi:ABC-type proline/glycine betaine transport system ATPase subunit